MCGIACILTKTLNENSLKSSLIKSNVVQRHRGPDMQDYRVIKCNDYLIGLAHQRLSILDLSFAGRQPMESHSGRYIIVFNGEVYNYKELALEYNLQDLRTWTDTEVVLELIEKVGPSRAFEQFNGMWAIVVLDRYERRIYISRDRAGIKPLYYTLNENGLFIASELKTVLSICGQKGRVNAAVAGKYLCQSLQDVDEETWIEGVKHFPKASFSEIVLDDGRIDIGVIEKYWSFEPESSWTGSFGDYVDCLKNTFHDAVRIRMRSDVPVGMTLSGGLDSSIIAAEVSSLIDGNSFNVLSVVSPGSLQDESKFIDIVGQHLELNVNKVELEMGSTDHVVDLLKTTAWINDAPIASFSNILFYRLMSHAKQLDTKVIFSGQGADELFCGYKKFPAFHISNLVKNGRVWEAATFGFPFIHNRTIFSQFTIAEAKRYLPWSRNRTVAGECVKDSLVLENIRSAGSSLSLRQWADFQKYSVPYLTHYEDRMSMAFAREIRLPFLDYRIVELGMNAPVNYKMQQGWTKFCLREAYKSYLPKSIVWRKDKQGFVNPQDDWLKNDLKEFVLSMITDGSSLIYEKRLVDKGAFVNLYNRYCAGDKTIWFRDVFSPIALNLWLEAYSFFLI